MRPEPRKYLYDICHAAEMLTRFTEGKTFEDYSQDDILCSAVERQFEVIGEALNQLSKIYEETDSQIDSYQRVIYFRNVMIHGYAQLDDRIVWDCRRSSCLIPAAKPVCCLQNIETR